jgi:hypothetical protein
MVSSLAYPNLIGNKRLGCCCWHSTFSLAHVIPPPGQMAKRKYCKWHSTFSHTTNKCNYFHRQVQSALNDSRLMLEKGHKMKLDTDPFPMNVNMINFEEKRILVRTSQAESTWGKNAMVSGEPRAKMVKPRSPEQGCGR